jgi:hypothetical protein
MFLLMALVGWLHLSSSPLKVNAFASTLFFRAGVKRVDGGIGSVMVAIALMMERAHYGR